MEMAMKFTDNYLELELVERQDADKADPTTPQFY